jgi:preprotein translocase subunit SecG
MYYALLALYVLICLLLLGVVLLQQGKGGDIAAAFGGASSQTAFGARAGATVLTRATTILGSLFLLGAFALTLMGRSGGSSVVSGVGGPAAAPASQQAPALPMPAIPAPTTPATGTATPPAAGTTAAPAPAQGAAPAPGPVTPAPTPAPAK